MNLKSRCRCLGCCRYRHPSDMTSSRYSCREGPRARPKGSQRVERKVLDDKVLIARLPVILQPNAQVDVACVLGDVGRRAKALQERSIPDPIPKCAWPRAIGAQTPVVVIVAVSMIAVILTVVCYYLVLVCNARTACYSCLHTSVAPTTSRWHGGARQTKASRSSSS